MGTMEPEAVPWSDLRAPVSVREMMGTMEPEAVPWSDLRAPVSVREMMGMMESGAEFGIILSSS